MYGGYLTLATPTFQKKFKGHVCMCGNVPAKFEVPSFNRFGIISIYFPKNYGSRYSGHANFSKKN